MLTVNGELYSVGDNSNGQLGINSTSNQSVFVKVKDIPPTEEIDVLGCGGYHCLFATKKGKVYSCGNNGNG